MPIGILINAACTAIGGLMGAKFGKFIPQRTQDSLSLVFGFASMVIGITLIVKVNALPAVILSLILGMVIGEGIRLEELIAKLCAKLKGAFEKKSTLNSADDDAYITKFISLLLVMCTSSTGIMGALTEGMTGDISLLMTKSVMDLFSAAVFAASMGALIALIAVPQLLIFIALFFFAGAIMPLLTPGMIGDLSACGGVITFVTGFRICEIKHLRVSNLLPALVLVLPISYFWSLIF